MPDIADDDANKISNPFGIENMPARQRNSHVHTREEWNFASHLHRKNQFFLFSGPDKWKAPLAVERGNKE